MDRKNYLSNIHNQNNPRDREIQVIVTNYIPSV